METQTIVAIVGVAGVLVGSAVGGVISFLSSRSMRRMEWELSLSEKNILSRESLYVEFLTEATRLMLQSTEEKISQTTAFTTFVSLESRIWFQSPVIGELAREIARCVLDSHNKEPKDKAKEFPELRDKYISECKKDLLALRKHV